MPKLITSNATFLVIFNHCELLYNLISSRPSLINILDSRREEKLAFGTYPKIHQSLIWIRAYISREILSGRTVGETKTNFARRRTKKFGKDGNVDHKKVILFWFSDKLSDNYARKRWNEARKIYFVSPTLRPESISLEMYALATSICFKSCLVEPKTFRIRL